MTENTSGAQSSARRELLQQALSALDTMQRKLDAVETRRREPIAIIGMGCRLPGGIRTPEQYWEFLIQGKHAIRRMPEQRWEMAAGHISDAVGQAPWGGFLDDIEQFDANFFGISRREAESMDPQQRLILEVGWEAIERADIDASTLKGSNTGVFVGATTTDYSHITLSQNPDLLDAYTATGSALNVIAGRFAYVLGLSGPAMAIDTACSSSLVALHLACQSLRLGESEMALAGGVNVILNPEPFLCFNKWGMMAPDGRCKTFDAAADGFVRSEGCGLLVLKRLSDAEKSGDPILAIIRGSAVNQDGRSSGLTVPNGPAQETVIRAALASAGLTSEAIGYVEAHGTGTRLGDPIELEALANVLTKGRAADQPLWVGSMKTNLGHLESASGVAGIMKVILALQHRCIPPHIHFHQLSDQIRIGDAAVEIPTKAVPWESRRIAGVSSFGFSGTNAHIILEGAADKEPPKVDPMRPSHILTVSARDTKALSDMARNYGTFFLQSTEPASNLSFSANTGRMHHKHRIAVVGDSGLDIGEKLLSFSDGAQLVSVIRGSVDNRQPIGVAFLFTGQGSQYMGMGRQLYDTQPTFRNEMDVCDEILRRHLGISLLAMLYPGRDQEEEQTRLLNQTQFSQPALFMLEYALARLWMAWGVTPSQVMGHSVGEYVAACVAGLFSLEDGLKLISERGRLMQELPSGGRMQAVFADEKTVQEAVEAYRDTVSIAACNGPENTVISGVEKHVSVIVAGLSANGIGSVPLCVSRAFHSPLMEPMLDDFERAAAQVHFSKLRIPLISTLTGKSVDASELSQASWWRRHVREPVQFSASVQTLYNQGCRLFVEIGPHPTLSSMASRCLPQEGAQMLPSLRRGNGDWQQMLTSLGSLFVKGVPVDWQGFDKDYSRCKRALPTYPFQREHFWISATGRKSQSASLAISEPGKVHHPLLGSRVDLPSAEGICIWQAGLDLKRCAYLMDHCIQGSPVFPATAYIELVLSAGKELRPQAAYQLKNLSFLKPLLLNDNSASIVQVWLREDSEESFKASVFSRKADGIHKKDQDWTLHMTTDLIRQDAYVRGKHSETFDRTSILACCPEQMDGSTFYADQAERGNQWGPCFQGIHTLWRGDMEALSQIRIPPPLVANLEDYLFHPAVADFSGHVLCATLPQDDPRQRLGAFVGGEIGEVRIYKSPVGRQLWSHARLRQDAQGDANVLIGDVRLWDENGELISETIEAKLRYLDRLPSIREPDVSKWMHEIRWVPFNQEAGSGQVDLSGQHWVIFSDTTGIGEALQQDVIQSGGIATMVRMGEAYRRDECGWRLRSENAADFKRFFNDIHTQDKPIEYTVVYLWNLDVPKSDEMTAKELRKWQIYGCGSALHVIQAMAGSKQAKKIGLYLITCGAQPSPRTKRLESPFQAPLWGIGRTAAIEHSSFWGGLVDLDPDEDADTSAMRLIRTIGTDGREDQCMFREGRLYTPRLRPINPDDLESRPLKIHENGSYLVTGGLGGIGFETSCWLHQKGARHLLIIGRTPISEQDRLNTSEKNNRHQQQLLRIRKLEEMGMKVTYFCGDAGDDAVFDQIQEALANDQIPPLRGIIHCAGIMQYELLMDHTVNRMLEIMKPKIVGGWLLHRRFLDQPIDLFVVYSSTSSILNSPFMGAYASGNIFLDALAAYRRSRGLPGMSISWGTWSETGMAVAENKDAGMPATQLKGVGTISNRAGLQALEYLLQNNVTHAGVMPMDWVEWRRAYPAFATMPFFRDLMDTTVLFPTPGHLDDQFENQTAREAAASGKIDKIEEYMTRVIALALKTTPERVPADTPLTSLGFDSLMAVEIKNRVEIDLHVEIPMVKLLEGQSVKGLSVLISEKLAMARTQGGNAADGAQGASETVPADQAQNWEEGEI